MAELNVRRFFECHDGGADWIVVARDLEHAQSLLREIEAGFGSHGLPYDAAMRQGILAWEEMTSEQVAKRTRCSREDGNPPFPLSEAVIGDLFCSEF